MLKYLKLENFVKILTLFISLLALVTFFQGIGFFKKKPKILIEFKNPIRVLHYQELKEQYENLTDAKLPRNIIFLLENRIEEAKQDEFSNFNMFQKLVRNVIFYEELPYGINSQEYFNKLHPMGVTLNDIEKLKIKMHPPEYILDRYKVELGIKEKQKMGYDELLALPPYLLGVSLLSNFEFPLSLSSINFPDIITKLSEAIEDKKLEEPGNLSVDMKWKEIKPFYKALSQSVKTYTVVIFKNAGKSPATNMMVIADLSNLSKVEIVDPVSRFVTKTVMLTSEDIQLTNPDYHESKLKYFEFSLPKLDSDQFRFLILKTTGGFPKRSNFSVKHDIFELPDKSVIYITFVIVLIITIVFVIIDFMLNTRKNG